MQKVKFKIRTIINPKTKTKQRENAIDLMHILGMDSKVKELIEMVEEPQDVTLLTYGEFMAWYALMVVCSSGFKAAYKAWERNDYYVDPSNGNKVIVTVMVGNEEYSL